jgi:hypothetical protein
MRAPPRVEVALLSKRRVIPCLLSLAAIVSLAAPASATSLVRRGIEDLTRDNETVVQASVLDIHSYWNAAHTFIFTDVHVRASAKFKGAPADELNFTVMGGTVGQTTTLIVGGPDLAPGSDYVLFLSHTDLPGAPWLLTVRDLCQGVFAVRNGRAFSQAIGEPLLPDAQGIAETPGGADGLPLGTLAQQIHDAR